MSPRALTIALIASLALNLFIIGTVVGGVLVGAKLRAETPAGAAGRPRQPLWTAADALPPEQRRAYRHLLRGRAQHVGAQMRESRFARREAWLSMAAEPFNANATAQQLALARTLETTARGGVEDRIVAFAATLPPAERAILAEGLARSSPGAGPRAMRGPRDNNRP